jgi:hypothetical protein
MASTSEPLAQPGAEGCAQRRPDRDEREQPRASLGAVDVGAEGPELGHQRDAEDADEQVEQDAQQRYPAQQQARLGQPEGHQQHAEQEADPRDQLAAAPARGEARVDRQDAQQQQALRERRIGLDFQLGQGADVGDRQPAFPHRLDQVEGEQNQKDIRHQDQAGGALARVDVGEQAQQPFPGGSAVGRFTFLAHASGPP